MSQVFDTLPLDYREGQIPVLLELPHGGHLTPNEVKPYLHPKFTPGDRREDSDEFSDELYLDLPAAPHVLRFRIWRAHADPNRPCDDLDADGAVKTLTSQGVKIYQSDRGLPAQARQQVIERYIQPHQRRLAELVSSPKIEKVLFCHTMPGIGTGGSNDKGELRPLIMFGNGGDLKGNPPNDSFAERALLLNLAEIVETSVGDLDVDFNFCDVIRYNHPYTGSHSLNRFDPELLRGKQSLTIEINRDLLLHNPDNIVPTRTIVNRLVLALAQWGRD
ncbi:N-formylglutamate amidohydrolase [uncultured Thiodictyon sp.]|uniref:N-formylglutamate amidohydrolase n=1 Tax=uncultured Thiodictyon sp. TaxID=1846217 RepID=UPI0025F792FE|nr:N-formylglutamate amidohydrolase [uncultured Thiodictyon sp.]